MKIMNDDQDKAAETFRCSRCDGVFEKAWSDEDACAEATAQFSDSELLDTAIVCNDCYRVIIGMAH